MSVPLYVVYRIDSINYKINYGLNYSPFVKKEKSIMVIDKEVFYVVLVQKKKISIVLNFFDNDLQLKKLKFKTYSETLDCLMDLNCVIVLKNVKKELAYLQENEPEMYDRMKNMKLYCLDNYLKYSLCLPLFIQGKISKRYRIPTIDEYIQKNELSINNSSFKTEFTKQRIFFKEILNDMIHKIGDFHRHIPEILDSKYFQQFIQYLICCGLEEHTICYITTNLNNKRIIEKNVNYNLVFLSPEQYKRNPKNYDFFILEVHLENEHIKGKSIMISPVPFQ